MTLHNSNQTTRIKKLLKVALTSFLFSSLFLSVQADDTEIFFSNSRVNSNVLFIIDNSGSMNKKVKGGTVAETKTITTSTLAEYNDAIEYSGWTSEEYDYNNNSGNQWKNTIISGELYLGTHKKKTWGNRRIGLRFEFLSIPQDAEIVSAHIQFTSKGNDSDNSQVKISIENIPDSRAFEDDEFRNIAKRSYYPHIAGDGISWQPAAWQYGQSGEAQKTPQLKELLQFVVSKDEWAEGNSMTFLINPKLGSTGTRRAFSADNNVNNAPKLVVQYKAIASKTRMSIMQDVLKDVLEKAPSNLSVGIMNYGGITNNPDGGRFDRTNGIRFPVKGIKELAYPILEQSLKVNNVTDWELSNLPRPQNEQTTVGQYLSDIANSWKAKGATPIVDALYEAARYYRGEQLYAGYGKSTWSYASHPTTYARVSPTVVEPVLQTKEIELCTGEPIKSRIWGANTIRNFRDNPSSWTRSKYKCPADKNAPKGPGSFENCQKYADPGYSGSVCKGGYICPDGKWVKRTTKEINCRTVDGARVCDTVTDTKAHCSVKGVWNNPASCVIPTCRNIEKPAIAPHYNTPVVSDCQSNNIILMSDGKPEYRKAISPRSKEKIQNLIGKSCEKNPFTYKAGECGAELTHFLADKKNDVNNAVDGNQTVNTFVIGFADGIDDNAKDYLKSLVTLVDDDNTPNKEGFFTAKDGEELAKAFTDTLKAIAQEARSQASPGYSVNVRSGLEHEDSIYIPVFDKSNSSVWSGNLKKFKLKPGVDASGNRHRYIRGRAAKKPSTSTSSLDAMDETGVFTKDAWDFWSSSDVADGSNVEKGGTAGLLDDPRERKLYSNIGSNKNLTASENQIKASNSNLTKTMLFDQDALGLNNAQSEERRKKLLMYVRGWKEGKDGGWGTGTGTEFTEDEITKHTRKHMGDMLHSEPVIITYNKGAGSDMKEQLVFAATNEGYLHAFNASDGEEVFAFMPKELLKNIDGMLYDKDSTHKYGVDGSISYFHDDVNHNGNVDSGEKVYLYFGLRRGGRSYYALDISLKDQPKLLWSINNETIPASGSIDTSENFSRLGQTWSMPYLANVVHSGTKKRAVIFTGGNEEYLDYGKGESYNKNSVTDDRETNNMGDDIYIVDAEDGSKLLWSLRAVMGTTGDNVVKHGLAGGVRILDVNGNGILDRMYFADTGGNVWRLDLSETLSTTATDSKLTKIASLSTEGSDDVYTGRKFYNEPDVARVIDNGKTIFTVSIGSGLRPHPMNKKINDHMFILLDESPLHNLTSSYETIKMADLTKVKIGVTRTEADNGDVTLTKTVTLDDDFEGKKVTELDKKGWYVEFNKMGEKVLSASTTFEGSIVFTTLVPEAQTTGLLSSVCAVPVTQGRIYAFNLLTGEPSADLDKDKDVDDQDVFETIAASEIPGTPQLIFNKLSCKDGSCKHEVDVRIGKKSTEVNTKDLSEVESIYWSDPAQ